MVKNAEKLDRRYWSLTVKDLASSHTEIEEMRFVMKQSKSCENKCMQFEA